MKDKHLTRRLLQYICGLICMAVGLVLLKQMALDLKALTGITFWGVSPITAVPDAVSNITPLTLGKTTILLHLLCVVGQVIVQRKLTLKSVLCMCVGVPFGYLVDFFMWLWGQFIPDAALIPAVVILVAGIAVQGFGVALISGCDLMLPAPDEMNNVIARVHGRKLGNVKMVADAVYVLAAVVINLVSVGSLTSVGISSVASVLLTGRFVGLSYRLLPGIRMEPFFHAPEAKKGSAA